MKRPKISRKAIKNLLLFYKDYDIPQNIAKRLKEINVHAIPDYILRRKIKRAE